MGIRYCMHCGIPVPRKAKICPECGADLNISAPKKDPESFEMPRFSQKHPEKHTEHRQHRGRQKANRTALFFSLGFVIMFCAATILMVYAGKEIKNARSRHRENMQDSKRAKQPVISIPDISLPDISIPEIHLPEPPAASFSVESYEIGTDLTGDTVLYVNVNYTNNAETEARFLTNFQISVQQEGKACKLTVNRRTDPDHLARPVQPDETALISEAFLINTETETAVSVSAVFGGAVYLEETIVPHADGTVSVSE